MPACSKTSGMVLVAANSAQGTTKSFYIDQYEASLKQAKKTDESGEKVTVTAAQTRSAIKPASAVNYEEAKVYCAAADKRLCTKAEWLTACVGSYNMRAALQPTPTDPSIDTLCFLNRPSGTVAVKTGANSRCRTRGITLYDMVGNVSEWVTDSASSEGRAMGANVASKVKNGKCSYFVQTDTDADGIDDTPIDEATNDETIGFRCCVNVEDVAT